MAFTTNHRNRGKSQPSLLARFFRDRRGNMAALVAVLIVPLIGIMGMAGEASSWFLIQRSMQNAADSAAIAAASNGSANPNGTTYISEAKSVTANYGFTDGTGNTTVTVINTDNTVPATCKSACYKVTIAKNMPLYLTGVLGYTGTVAMGGGRGQTITTSAVASPQVIQTTYCLLSLGSGDGFHINGGSNIDLKGCYVRSNGDATCNGANANGNAASIIYSGSNKKCTPSDYKSTPLADPYSALGTNNIPNYVYPNNGGCGTAKSGYANTNISGPLVINGPTKYCGDVTLTANANVTAGTADAAIIIEDGTLNLNAKTLTDIGVPIIFTGPKISGFSPVQYPTGGGTLDIAAPTSGIWSGVAIYQSLDPAIATVNISYSGNTPTWNITGLVYMPKANLTFSGAVNKSANGYSCLSIVDLTFQANGTGSIYSNSQAECRQAGLVSPSDDAAKRVSLVQ